MSLPDLDGLSDVEARARLEAAGWRVVGVGDWATVLADPSDTECVRLVPWDPAHRLFADDVLAAPPTPYLPRLHEIVDLAGEAYAVRMERLWPAPRPVAQQLCDDLDPHSPPRADLDPHLVALRDRLARLDERGASRHPWTWGGPDVRAESVLVSADGSPG